MCDLDPVPPSPPRWGNSIGFTNRSFSRRFQCARNCSPFCGLARGDDPDHIVEALRLVPPIRMIESEGDRSEIDVKETVIDLRSTAADPLKVCRCHESSRVGAPVSRVALRDSARLFDLPPSCRGTTTAILLGCVFRAFHTVLCPIVRVRVFQVFHTVLCLVICIIPTTVGGDNSRVFFCVAAFLLRRGSLPRFVDRVGCFPVVSGAIPRWEGATTAKFQGKVCSWTSVTCIRLGEVFPAAAGAFFRQKWRSCDFMTCIRLVEVFPAAAGAFLSAKMPFLGFYDMH